jgi:lipopolysaccharide biosynthesis glycosyltransferase
MEKWLPRACLIYVTDARYLPLTLTSLLTAPRTMPSDMDAIIYLDDVSATMRDEARAFLRDWGVEAELVDFDIETLFPDTGRIPLWREGISRAGFARLGLCGAPSGYETHVVLDGDTLVGGDMRELISVRPNGMAAVPGGHSRKGWAYLYADRSLPMARDYLNAGLMMFNADMWQAERIEQRCMALVQDRSLDSKLARPMRDQEILNLIFGNTFHRLNPNWNFKVNRSWRLPREVPLIAHFAGRLAPWDARDQRALPVFRQIYAEVFDRLPKALTPAVDSLMLSGRNLRHSRRFKPALGRWNRNHQKAWNPANAPMVADWPALLPWNR